MYWKQSKLKERDLVSWSGNCGRMDAGLPANWSKLINSLKILWHGLCQWKVEVIWIMGVVFWCSNYNDSCRLIDCIQMERAVRIGLTIIRIGSNDIWWSKIFLLKIHAMLWSLHEQIVWKWHSKWQNHR